MNFGMIIINQNIKTMQDYFVWILTALLFILKLEIFIEIMITILKKWFDTSNSSEDDKRPLPRGMNKKVTVSMKDELGGKIMAEFVALRPKTQSYLMDNVSERKTAKGTKRGIIKKEIKFKITKIAYLKKK